MLRVPAFFERSMEKCKNFNKETSIIYTRISKEKQSKGLSLQSQLENCTNYCDNYNFDIIRNFSEIASAKNISNQTHLKHIIEHYNHINLIVNDVSRFSRNVKDGVSALDELHKKDIILHIVDKELHSNINNDYKMILSGLKDAEIEIETLSKRMKRTIKYKKDNNLYLPSVPKYGLKYVRKFDDNKIITKIEINMVEQKIIQLINKMFFGSKSDDIEELLIEITGNVEHEIYDYVNNHKISEIKRGNMTKKDIAEFLNHINILKRGKKWSSFMISNILQKSN